MKIRVIDGCIDWFRIIADLAHHEITVRKLSRKLGVSRSTVGRWYRGDSVPDFDTGEQLIALWCKETQLPACNAPRKMNGRPVSFS